MSMAWWLIENPLLGGVLKVSRLKARTGGGLSDLFGQAIPCSIASSSLVVDQHDDDDDSDDIVVLGGCSLCGERHLKHWNESDVTQSEKDVSVRWRSILSALDGESKALKIVRHRMDMETAVSCTSSAIATTHAAAAVAMVVEDKRAKRKETSVGREHQCSGHAKPNAAVAVKKRRRIVPATEASSDSVVNVICLDEGCIADDDEVEAAAPPSSAGAAIVAMDDPTLSTAPSLQHGDVETCAVEHGKEEDKDDRSNSPRSAEGVHEFADHRQSTRRSDGSSITPDANKAILELQAENAQLRGEIEITMRKADRRFEQELVSGRAWNREREALEARIEELQRSHVVLTAELASRTRLQEALREMLSTA